MKLENYIDEIRTYRKNGQVVHLVDSTYTDFHIRINNYCKLLKPNLYGFFAINFNQTFIDILLSSEVLKVEVTPRNEVFYYLNSIYNLCNQYYIRRF